MQVVDFPDGTRLCNNCRLAKAIDQFDLDKNGTGGRRAHCKPCRSQKMKDWYAANQARQAARAQARRDADPERHRTQDSERYHRNKAERIALVEASWHRRRAAKMQAPRVAGITKTALRKILGDRCCYCNVTMDFSIAHGRSFNPTHATIEHVVPLSRGGAHDWPNMALCCRQCNTGKNARTAEEWMAHLSG